MTIEKDAIPLLVPHGTSVRLTKRRTNNFGRFQAVGEFSTLDKKSKYDILETVVQLSKGAQRLFIKLVTHRDDTNRVIIKRNTQIGTASYKTEMRLFKEIRSLSLMTKAKRSYIPVIGLDEAETADKHVLLINPGFIKCRNQMNAQLYWDIINEKS